MDQKINNELKNDDNLNKQSNPFINVERRDLEEDIKELKKEAKQSKKKDKKKSLNKLPNLGLLKNRKKKNPTAEKPKSSFNAKSEAFNYHTLESADQKEKKVEQKPEKEILTRRIYKRNIALSIIYTVISLGVYGLFWQYEIAKETNAVTKDNKGFTPALVLLFSILTCGIYAVYWSYQCGQKQARFYMEKKNIDSGCYILYMVLMICAYVVPFLNLIAFAFMQFHLNKILNFAEEESSDGIYTRDSSIFNRPFWSAALLILIAQVIPQYVTAFYEMLFPNAPGNLLNVSLGGSAEDIVNMIVQNSADQIIYADTPFVISYNLISIFCFVFILWWFSMRFKYSKYSGILVLKNLGRGLLLGLPGLLFVAFNFIDFNVENFKFGLILMGFVPAFSEEITFRGLLIPNWMRIYNNSKGIWISLIGSSLIFGLIHLANTFSGADFGTTVFQTCYATALGVLFAGILIRTGNLWVPIILHGLIDAVSFMSDAALEQGAVQTQAFTFSWELIPIIVISLFFIGYGIWLCRPKKHEEICSLWSDKWGDAIINR